MYEDIDPDNIPLTLKFWTYGWSAWVVIIAFLCITVGPVYLILDLAKDEPMIFTTDGPH
jgi:hypothetical protein